MVLHMFCQSWSSVCSFVSWNDALFTVVIRSRFIAPHIHNTSSSCLWNACQAWTLLTHRYHFHSHLMVFKPEFLVCCLTCFTFLRIHMTQNSTHLFQKSNRICPHNTFHRAREDNFKESYPVNHLSRAACSLLCLNDSFSLERIWISCLRNRRLYRGT